ncbi:MAG: DUF1573 domain-containing protein [Ignavibacteria bacterium]|nr:DUF1573 domain-containing protein [Ignavibacteria bacterium]
MTKVTIHIASLFTFLVICAVLPGTVGAQQNIGGVVNQYVQVTEISPCDSLLRVGNPANFSPGDRVLIIQMKGAKIVTANDSTFGNFTDLNWAGCAEFLTITRINGDQFYFGSKLVHTYDPDGNVQLVKVARYKSARVTKDIVARPWNGSIGGVVAIEVEEDLTLNADITVSGQGFRGGVVSVPVSRCSVYAQLVNWSFGTSGAKGEGIVNLPVIYQPAGRGPLGNGGGGGNGNNAGGAGGGNGGNGGDGGSANRHCDLDKFVGGRPGKGLDSLVPKQRFFFGGGGGGGHQNDTLGTSGANGGGIVFLIAKTIISYGHTISADGQSVLKPAEWDGAGGGGAGGTIYIDAAKIYDTLNVSARGGDGGIISHKFNAHGPGGGGGGGVIVYKQPTENVVSNVSPGVNGTHTYPDNDAFGLAWDSKPGDTGVVINRFNWKVPADLILSAWGGGPICPGQMQILGASDGYIKYKWSNGANTKFTTVSTPGVYSVITTDSSGCVYTAGGLRVWDNSPQYTVDAQLDFGTVDFKKAYTKSFAITNNDDDSLVIQSIGLSNDFIVIQPASFPVSIAPGKRLDILVSFFADEDRSYSDTLDVVVLAPCPSSRVVDVTAVVNPIKIVVYLSDTTAKTGDLDFPIPIRSNLVPDTISLPDTKMRLTVRFDSKLFAPKSVTVGSIVSDNIDLIGQKRTLTIEIESIDIKGGLMTLTEFRGTVLSAALVESPLELVSVEWLKVWQSPRTTVRDGNLAVLGVCYQKGRIVRLFALPTLSVSPNPASDDLNTSILMTAPGLYTLRIIDIQGMEVYSNNIEHNSIDKTEYVNNISTRSWSQGLYFVVYTTPLLTTSQIIVIER